MTIAFYMNCVSTHQLPLAKEVASLIGVENFRYIDAGLVGQANQTIGHIEPWITSDKSWLETAGLVLTGLRDFEVAERRTAKGLKTFYYSERWFKPFHGLPGWVRMLVPGYRRMVKRFVKWANTDPGARVLAIGPWAKKDFLRMGVKAEKIVDWGYFVAPSTSQTSRTSQTSQTSRSSLRVLWVGRDLAWKRVKDIDQAVALANKNLNSAVHLHLNPTPISFTRLTGVTPDQVRQAMREHDLYVLASNAEEGWGAALNEALEEGMNAVGTFEAGASAAILPRERLYHAGDVGALAKLIEKECRGELPRCEIGEWTAKTAAKRLMEMV